MPVAFQWNPGIVVQQNELRSPVDRDRKASAQADAQNGDEALWPGVGWAEGRGRPVNGPHERTDSASRRKDRLFKLRAHCAQPLQFWVCARSILLLRCSIVTDRGLCGSGPTLKLISSQAGPGKRLCGAASQRYRAIIVLRWVRGTSRGL